LNRINLYAILGLPKNASSKDITSAYRKLALKYHPDRNKSPFANDMMLKINTAYNILSDPIKREEYDYSLLHPEKINQPEQDFKDDDHVYSESLLENLWNYLSDIRSRLKISTKILFINLKRIINFLNSK
jgi:molecular chaperone DnaJ